MKFYFFMNVLRSLPVRSGDIACFGSFTITRYKEIPCCRCTQFFSVIQCSDAHGFMDVNAGWKLCKLRRLLISSKTSWSYRRWKITRNSIKFWLIIPGELPSIFLYIHVESINLKTKPVKIVQSYNEFIERQGKRSWNVPSWREDWGT